MKKVSLISTTLFLSIASYAKPVSKLTKLSFSVETNMASFAFSGNLKKHVPITKHNEGYALSIDPKDLTTDMEMRDEHMREKIFKNSFLNFSGNLKCTNECLLIGKLSVAKVVKQVSLKIKRPSQKDYILHHTIKLSDFNIDAPEFMGVKVNDNVKITATFN